MVSRPTEGAIPSELDSSTPQSSNSRSSEDVEQATEGDRCDTANARKFGRPVVVPFALALVICAPFPSMVMFEPVATLVRRSTLEDVFLRLTGRTLVD